MKRETPKAGPSSEGNLSGESIPQPPAIPDHELLRRIGGGSYGEVWLARNAIGGYRAVKIVSRATFEHERPFEREFAGIKKFEPISRSHEGLVDLLQVGRNDAAGYFYYVMELADDAGRERSDAVVESWSNGETPPTRHSSTPRLQDPSSYCPKTLRSLLRPNSQPSTLNPRPTARLPLDECIQLGLALTNALAYLHGQGLVHRDIKPSNIIFVGGMPKLADVGLVTGVDEARSYVGTEGFIPPEGPGSPQADLYSLGILLYVMSTGKSHQDFPEPLADFAGQPDHARWLEFNAVIHKACDSDPRRRYASAKAMNDDLVLLQRGQSVKQNRKLQERIRASWRIGLATAGVVLVAAAADFLWQTLKPHSKPAGEILGTQNHDALQAYYEGQEAMRLRNDAGFGRAVDRFNAAIKLDSRWALPRARLFEAYLMSEDYDIFNAPVGPEGEGKVEQLNNLATNLFKLSSAKAETRAALAIVLFLNEWRWDDAENEFKKALNADPDCRMALVYYGYMLTRQLRAKEASAVLKRALDHDKDSPLITKFLGHCEYVRRDYDSALKLYWKASDLGKPTYPGGCYWAMRVNFVLGNYEQALDDLEDHEKRQGLQFGPEVYETFRQALEKDRLRARGYWLKCLERIQNIKDVPYWYAECHARLGHKAEALKALKIAIEKRDTVTDLLVDEFWDDYRNDPEFKALLHQVGGLDRWAR